MRNQFRGRPMFGPAEAVQASRRAFLAGAGAAVLAPAAAGAAETASAPTPHTIEELYASSPAVTAALSPDGSKLALLLTEATGKKDRERSALVVLATDDIGKPNAAKAIPLGETDSDYLGPVSLLWANENRLLVTVMYLANVYGYDVPTRRVASIDPALKSPSVWLFGKRNSQVEEVFDLGDIVDDLPADPDHVLIAAWSARRDVQALYRVNVNTGVATEVERGGSRTLGWSTNFDGTPVLRYDRNGNGSVVTVSVRALGETEWKPLRKFKPQDVRDFDVVAHSDRPSVLIVIARQPGEDTASVRELDLATLVYGPPLYKRDGLDASHALIDRSGRLMAAAFYDERIGYDFVDRAFAGHYRGLEKFWGGLASIRLLQSDRQGRRFVGYVTAPDEPGAYLYYDRQSKVADLLARSEVKIDRERLALARPLRTPTRDGQKILSYLTAPLGERPGPLIVLPHGGPEARDYFEFDRWVQALASRGWWVLQPNFRGSGGFGRGFTEAGHRRWANRMQEDVEDAAEHVIAAKGLDRSRVAIMGASYGGYAALMGAVRRPDLYRAAVSICGDADLPEMLEDVKRDDDTPDGYAYRIWTTRAGDPKTDMAALIAASPSRRAGEIRAPVLLYHGLDDEIVRPRQSRIMAKALKAAGKPYEHVEVKDEGHPLWSDAEDKKMILKIVDFVGKAFQPA